MTDFDMSSVKHCGIEPLTRGWSREGNAARSICVIWLN